VYDDKNLKDELFPAPQDAKEEKPSLQFYLELPEDSNEMIYYHKINSAATTLANSIKIGGSAAGDDTSDELSVLGSSGHHYSNNEEYMIENNNHNDENIPSLSTYFIIGTSLKTLAKCNVNTINYNKILLIFIWLR
jgi:hypothetical protein